MSALHEVKWLQHRIPEWTLNIEKITARLRLSFPHFDHHRPVGSMEQALGGFPAGVWGGLGALGLATALCASHPCSKHGSGVWYAPGIEHGVYHPGHRCFLRYHLLLSTCFKRRL